MLSREELERYDRQIRIFGEDGQKKLKRARVLIAGIGGLGSSISIYLTAAGVGRLILVDSDIVELSNLNRQVLHWDKDVGKSKVRSAEEKLRGLNPEVDIEALSAKIDEGSVFELARNVDVIVDAMDNFETRYLLNRVALKRGVPMVHGGVRGFDGQVTTIVPGETACLRCIFPKAPPRETFPILGATAGVIGCIQAMEVVKYVVGVGELLKNRLLLFNGQDMKFSEVEVVRNPKCEDCGGSSGEREEADDI